jgi:nitroimidazol reductase NimA-like FMN-containing flavoprotein (pyridoxamine 5'-phosphate oxidase superfamily)
MAETDPIVELDERYSEPAAKPTSWAEARKKLAAAGVYWLSTTRPDGRPHVTPIAAVWLEGALYFSTGPDEQKSRNLAGNRHVVVTTGSNQFGKGLDVVVEGEAKPISDEPTLAPLAEAFAAKYDDVFGFKVGDGRFSHDAGVADVYEIAPVKAFAYRRGTGGSATRFRF